MKNPFYKSPTRAFSLVEVLGAVAVLATLAAVSIVSIKDTVQAGQKASAQREIQALNAALQSFKSAGGVIPANATVDEVVQALKVGTDLAGRGYAPLTNDPSGEVQIAGATYA
jgi:type II secretory pathway pseudopilin PulG